MDENLGKRCCPNCSQPYRLKPSSTGQKQNFPLFLKCGHGICENCIRNIIKFLEPIECQICHQDMEIEAAKVKSVLKDTEQFYKLFPINMMCIGELTVDTTQNIRKKAQDNEDSYFLDLESLLENKDKCVECEQLTATKCKQCTMNLCKNCFNKTHKNFVIFKNHVLQNIDAIGIISNCKTHMDKPLNYYCEDCAKAICSDCMIVGGEKSCQKHKVVTMQEMNEILLEELIANTPKLKEILNRLTKTAVDVGTLQYNKDTDSGPQSDITKHLMDIEQYFSKISAKLQSHKQNILTKLLDAKCDEQQSLEAVKKEIAHHIKEIHNIVKCLEESFENPDKLKQTNLLVLSEAAKAMVNTPWYLKKEDSDEGPLKITVNEELCDLIDSYVKLEGSPKCVYKLLSESEMGDIEIPPPPNAPVYPPVFVKDVRQINAPKKPVEVQQNNQGAPVFFKSPPKYRSKSASISSLNSTESDASSKSYITSNDGYPVRKINPVFPFKEDKEPKSLSEGTQELIYLSHIVDPHNFYVQRASHQGLVKEMLLEFKNAAQLPKPTLKHVAEGKLYLAFNKADNMWQRCRLLGIDRHDPNNYLFQVFFIDFGSTEILPFTMLRLLSPTRWKLPPLAIHCSLANCVPRSGCWSQEDSLLIHNIVNNKQAVIHVRHVRPTSNYAVRVDVDLITFEDGVNIAHALVFHERAKLLNPNLTCPSVAGIVEKPTIFINHNDYKYKSIEDVYITHVQSPDKFFVRKRHFQDKFNDLSADLIQEYGLTDKNEPIYLPEKGMVCIANIEKWRGTEVGARWARALVLELSGKARVRLALVDIGGEAVLPWTALRRIHHKYTTYKALATECYLSGVTPLNRKWSPASVTMLKKYEEKLLQLHVEDTRRHNSLGVVLYFESEGETKVCINSEMIKQKFAVAVGVCRFNNDADAEGQVATGARKKEDHFKKAAKPKQTEMVILKKKPPTVIKKSDLEAKDKGPLRIEAKVANYQSPSLIYFTLAHQQQEFNVMFENLQKYYSNLKEDNAGDTVWEVGKRCCVFCEQSQTWRRATILELSGDTAKVFYTDFALTETVPVKGLKVLPPKLDEMGDAVLKCHLSSVVPAIGDEWPSLTKEYLKELLDAYKRVFITKVGNFKDKSMPVEIWVYHIIQGGALEPNRAEWRCLNKKIIEQGLGVPDKEQEKTTAENSAAAAGDDDKLSFLNLTGSVHDWLQLEPMRKKVEKPTSAERDDASENVVYVTDWLPPEPFSSTEFTGTPTYVDNDGVIYLHEITQQDTLDLIRKALDMRFKQPDPKAIYMSWVVGEPCVALYYLDERFYRGRVQEVYEEEKTCLIHYIDYGNEEVCKFENMRKMIALHEIPVQAHKCVLDRIAPLKEKWDRETLDYIHKSVVEKNCYIKITGEPIDGVVPIELKYDKLYINDHLVDFELAKYKDGSQAAVPKFAGTVDCADDSSDSEPDYIIEEDSKSENSFNIDAVKGRDWNTLLDTDAGSSSIDSKSMLTFGNYNETEFVCNIFVINDVNSLELSVIHDDDTAKLYDDMFTELQIEAESMPPLNGIHENKACIVLFNEDEQWYRASILQYNKDEGKIKVRYVDYGNIGIISLSDAREVREEWTALPPRTVTARLYGLKLNPDINVDTLSEEFTNIFMDKGPFNAKVVEFKENMPYVELKNSEGQLVYQSLIDKEIFVKSESTAD